MYLTKMMYLNDIALRLNKTKETVTLLNRQAVNVIVPGKRRPQRTKDIHRVPTYNNIVFYLLLMHSLKDGTDTVTFNASAKNIWHMVLH